jgi:hypothetical protein
MEVVPVHDIPRKEAVASLSRHRLARYGVIDPPEIMQSVIRAEKDLTEGV